MTGNNSKKTFHGGAHPYEGKELTENLKLEVMPDPKTVIVPLSQHIGKPSKPLVKKGSEVKEGEVIAEAQGFVSIPIHSPVSGKVMKVQMGPHASGFPREEIVIKPSEEESEKVFMEPMNAEAATAGQIKDRVRDAGIVGQGGAAFPTFIKLSPPDGKKIDCIILNGAECEPYLTRDYRLMLERTEDVVQGLKLLMKAAGVDRGYIGIEDNKPEAIAAMRKAVEKFNDVFVEVMKTKYPQGAEKMLIKALTGREVPPGKLPLDVGVIVQNIGTSLAVYEAVVKGQPLISAALTVTGGGITEPKNLIVKVGTPLQEVLDYCGGLKPDSVKVIAGGPMMGVAQYDMTAPVMKATSGILVLSRDEVTVKAETPCVRCGKCINVCPLNLMPTKLARLSQLEKYEDAEEFGVTVCMECGTCAYVCPANLPLVTWMRLGKSQVMAMQRARKPA